MLLVQGPARTSQYNNMSSQEKSALRTDKNIVIMPSDKGRARVVMDKGSYSNKINCLLRGGECVPLNKYPRTKI